MFAIAGGWSSYNPRMRTLLTVCCASVSLVTWADLKHPDWHPDGVHLLAEGSCAGTIDLYIIDTANAVVHPLYADEYSDGYPRWFADGRRFAFHEIDEKNDARLFVGEVDENFNPLSITPVTNGPFDISPAPSPDGRRLVYAQNGSRGLDLAILDIERRSMTSRWVTEDAENFPSWHPSGLSVVYHSNAAGVIQVFQRGIETDLVAQLTDGPGPNMQGHLSADAGLLVFASERDDDREIYLRDMQSLEDKRLTDRPGRDGYPKLSPDNSQVAFHRTHDGGAVTTVVLNLDSGHESDFSCSQVN